MNVSSPSGKIGNPGQTNYSAAKEAEVPLGRAGTPEEVADPVVFLAGPMASYINGAVLEVTGGRDI